MSSPSFAPLLDQALARRAALFETLHAEKTDAYRLFHGIAEGWPGLTIDRYGELLLVQTFREPLVASQWEPIEAALRAKLDYPFVIAYNHRGKNSNDAIASWYSPEASALSELKCLEFGAHFWIRARHQGIDPWLFLDLRAGRRYLREHVQGLSVLNLFSYTCSVGVSAAMAGASEVWNIDFAASSLEAGRRNARLNEIPEDRIRMIESDCLPVMRQLAGLSAGGRRGRVAQFPKFEARVFDVVFLDPPAWSKGSFGAVDVAGDYPSLFKSAVLAARPGGGRVIATNHVATVQIEDWIDILQRCAAKAGRPLRSCQQLSPESDFPSFDGRPPLKIVVCEV